MKILITGAKGFIGKNLIQALKMKPEVQIYEYDVESPKEELEEFCSLCDFVYHLAGVNRPKDLTEFISGNMLFTLDLIKLLKNCDNPCPVVFSSSIQALLDNPYGISKRACEDFLFYYGRETGAKVYVYRFPNIFGKWSRPNYNSVIATFCYNLTHGLPIQINDPRVILNLVYIDDLVKELVSNLEERGHKGEDGFYYIPEVYNISLGRIVEVLYTFQKEEIREEGVGEEDAMEKTAMEVDAMEKDATEEAITEEDAMEVDAMEEDAAEEVATQEDATEEVATQDTATQDTATQDEIKHRKEITRKHSNMEFTKKLYTTYNSYKNYLL